MIVTGNTVEHPITTPRGPAETNARDSQSRYRTTDDRTRHDHGGNRSTARAGVSPTQSPDATRAVALEASWDLRYKTAQKCHGGLVVTG
jgi:hypothetical protein